MNLAENIILPGDSGKRIERGGRIAVLKPGNIWTRDRERQIRELYAARFAVERHRRRSRHGPPLCSTTFGGSTVPPIFGGGGGGFLQGDIRIATVGADYIGPLGGAPATVLPGAGAAVGDELWQAVVASGTWTNPANWTPVLDFASVLFQRFRTYRRIADGTANDDFIFPLNTLMVVGKQWSLAEVLPFDAFPSFVVQGGTINSTATTQWDVGFPPGTALTAVAGGDPSKWVLGNFAAQDRQQPGGSSVPTISDGNPAGMETLASIGAFLPTGGFSVDTIVMLETFQYLPVSVAYPAYTIGRTPGAPNTWSQYTQYSRLQIF